jgi:hypothetical protein
MITRENDEQLDEGAFIPTLNRHPTALYLHNPNNRSNNERTVDEVEAFNNQF